MDEVERIVRTRDPGLESGPDVADDLIRDIRAHVRRVAEAVQLEAIKRCKKAEVRVRESYGVAESVGAAVSARKIAALDLDAIIEGVGSDA